MATRGGIDTSDMNFVFRCGAAGEARRKPDAAYVGLRGVAVGVSVCRGVAGGRAADAFERDDVRLRLRRRRRR